MSKRLCRCGHVISDTTDYLSFKAALIRYKAEESFYEAIVEEAKSLMTAAAEGQLRQWVHARWEASAWSPKPEELCYDHLSGLFLEHFTDLYECEQCGRLWVQEQNSPHFKSYVPESGTYEAILNQAVPDSEKL